MIPVKDKSTVIDNMGGEKTAMTVRSEDWHKISGLLINLYSDTIMACVREYSTNALDAHIACGSDEPIEVELPTHLNLVLTIRDFGTGMDKEALQKTYAMFGASTKDTSNDFNGAMGLGSKSALTYADSFTVVSVKDGIKTTAIIGKNSEGHSELEILAEEKTDDPNGTTIEIPVKRDHIHQFGYAAEKLFKWWKPNTVLVDGALPRHFDPKVDLGGDYTELRESVYYEIGSRYHNSNTLRVIMGNVMYEHTFEGPFEDFARPVHVTAFIPNGSVQFSPSRESLLMNRATTKYVEAIMNEVKEDVLEKFKTGLEEAETFYEALKYVGKYVGLLNRNTETFVWNGIPVISTVNYSGRAVDVLSDSTSQHNLISVTNQLGAWKTIQDEPLGEDDDEDHIPRHNSRHWANRTAIIDSDLQNMSGDMRRAVQAYNNSLPFDKKARLYLYAGRNDLPQLADIPRANIDDIRKFYVKTKKNNGNASQGTYRILHVDEETGSVRDHEMHLPEEGTIILASPTDLCRRDTDKRTINYSREWLKLYPDHFVVAISTNRFAKFKRDNADREIIEWHTMRNKVVEDHGSIEGFSDIAKKALVYVEDMYKVIELNGLTRDKLIDRYAEGYLEIDAIINKWGVVASGFGMSRGHHTYLRELNEKVIAEGIQSDLNLEARYPMLVRVSQYRLDCPEVIDYINMVYDVNYKTDTE